MHKDKTILRALLGQKVEKDWSFVEFSIKKLVTRVSYIPKVFSVSIEFGLQDIIK